MEIRSIHLGGMFHAVRECLNLFRFFLKYESVSEMVLDSLLGGGNSNDIHNGEFCWSNARLCVQWKSV